MNIFIHSLIRSQLADVTAQVAFLQSELDSKNANEAQLVAAAVQAASAAAAAEVDKQLSLYTLLSTKNGALFPPVGCEPTAGSIPSQACCTREGNL